MIKLKFILIKLKINLILTNKYKLLTKFKYVNDVWFVKSLVNVSFIVSWIR